MTEIELSRNLGDMTKLGLTLAEAKRVLGARATSGQRRLCVSCAPWKLRIVLDLSAFC